MITVLLLLLSIAVFGADLYLSPETLLPGPPYAAAPLIAAFLLAPNLVAVVAVGTFALHLLAFALHPADQSWVTALYVVATGLFGLIAWALAIRTSRAASLREEAQMQRARLEAVLRQMPAGVVIAEAPSDRVIMDNKALARDWGQRPPSPSPTGGNGWPGFHPEDGRPYRREEWPLSRSIATGEPVTNEEIEVVRGDGSRGTLSVSSAAIRDNQGRVVAGIMVGLDITERKRAAAELERLTSVAQRRAAELQAVFDTMVDGVFVCDAEGQLTIINPAGESMMKLVATLQGTEPQAGLAAFAGMRRPDGSLVGYENLPIVRALAGNVVLLDDAVCTPPGGPTVYLRTSAAPIRDQAGQIVGAVAVVRDVTELLELDRLKDQFLNLAAHELKTPLAIMKGYAQILLRQPGAVPDANRRMLEAINRGTDRISGVVNDLLDVAQLEQGQLKLEKENVDLAALVEQVVNEMSLIAPNHRLRVIRSEPVVIKGDRYRLRQVINHLVENAVRFSPKGGDIDLAVDVRGPEAVVSVEDHGVGIPKGKQPRLFQRFYRAHADTPHDYGGIGIGLYIAKEVVLRHGGRMWFESEEGKGSTFYFALPLAGEGISQVDA